MRSRLRNDLNRAQRSAIVFTTLLAGFLASCIYFQVSRGPVLKKARISKGLSNLASPTVRQPANAVPKLDTTTQDIRISCSAFRTPTLRIQVPSTVERMRIFGRECDLDAGPGDTVIVSQVSNGAFSGTLLLPKPGYYISDYIPLDSAENTVVLKYKMPARDDQKLVLQVVRTN